MPHTMEVFKRTRLMGLSTDYIPSSAYEENFGHGRTHYYQSLLIGDEYKQDEGDRRGIRHLMRLEKEMIDDKGGTQGRVTSSLATRLSPPEHLKEKYNLDTATKLAWDKPNKCSGDADLSKDKSCPESPLEFRRSWYVEGHIRSIVISTVLMQRSQAAHVNLSQHLAPSVGLGILIYPKEGGMVDLQPMEEEFQGVATREENIDVLRTMIKEHDQQAKMKATPRKLAYADSDKEAPAGSLAKGFSDRFSLKSSSTSDTRRKNRSTIKS
ncbi:hypothetical protein Tco_0961779 [Tanacetum coccineum]